MPRACAARRTSSDSASKDADQVSHFRSLNCDTNCDTRSPSPRQNQTMPSANCDIQTHASAAEIAEAMKVAKRSVERRAAREQWASRPRAGRGGGVEYVVSKLPQDVRIAVARKVTSTSAIAHEGALIVRAQKLAQTTSTTARTARRVGGLAEVQAMPTWARQVAEARVSVLAALDRFTATSGLSRAKALDAFAAQYSAGEAFGLDVDVVERAGRDLSSRTLRRWQDSLAGGGLVSLAPAYGTRSERVYETKVDALPQVRDLVLGTIHEMGPHLNVRNLRRDIVARFGAEHAPSVRTLQTYVQRWRDENTQVAVYLDSPESWKGKFMPAYGRLDEGVTRLNQIWELDSTLADIALLERLPDGSTAVKRYSLAGVVDVCSRRAMYLVCRTSSSAAIRLLLRRAVLAWGVPEKLRMDNGKDYASQAVDLFCAQVGVDVHHCKPFHPEEKPFIERMYRGLQHSEMERLPGFVGHNVTDQQKRRARLKARQDSTGDAIAASPHPMHLGTVALTAFEFETWLANWCSSVYGERVHESLRESPNARAARLSGDVQWVPDPAMLDLLLDPVSDAGKGAGVRTITKRGIEVGRSTLGERLFYIAPELAAHTGEEVMCFYDPYAAQGETPRLAVHRRVDMRFIGWAEAVGDAQQRQRIALDSRAHARSTVQEGARLLSRSAKRAGVGDTWLHLLGSQVEKDLGTVEGRTHVEATPGMAAAVDAAGARTTLQAVRLLSEPLTDEERASREALEAELRPRAERPLYWDNDRHRAEWLQTHPEDRSDIDRIWLEDYERRLLGDDYGLAAVG